MLENHKDYLFFKEKTQKTRELFHFITFIEEDIKFEDFKFLMEKFNITNHRILRDAIHFDKSNKITHYLIEKDYDFYLKNDYEQAIETVLHAAFYNKEMMRELILKYKVDIWNPPEHLEKIWHLEKVWCDRKGDVEFMKIFIDGGADVNLIWDEYDETLNDEYLPITRLSTPISYAVAYKEFKGAEYLLSRGAIPNNPLCPAIFVLVRESLKRLIYELDEYQNCEYIMNLIRFQTSMVDKIQFAIQYLNVDP